MVREHGTRPFSALTLPFLLPAGQVGAGPEGVGVLGAEDTLAVGQDLLPDGDGVGGAPGRPIREGELGRTVRVSG